MLDADALDELRQELTSHQWRLLLKLGLCLGCQLALRQAVGADEDIEEFDYGAPFPEELE